MKKIFFLFLYLVTVLPFYALAQDGSAGTSDGTSAVIVPPAESATAAPNTTPSLATTSAASTPTSPARPSEVINPANPPTPAPLPSSVPPPAPAVAEPISAPVPEIMAPTPLSPAETEQTPTSENPGINLYLLLAAIPAVLAGAYAALRLRSKQNQKEEESEQRCFDVKKLMEEKFNELTDLKGQLEGGVKGMAREIAKEIIQGTPAEDIMATIERAEKEYERFKKLYEKCIITAKAGKRVFIVHGGADDAEQGWFSWAKKEFERRGFGTHVPAIPEASRPATDVWVSRLSEVIGKPDKNTYLVGHSIGVQAILRYLERLPKDEKIGGAIFVGGWFTPANVKMEKEIIDQWTDTPIDPEKIKQHCAKIFAIFSDNDDVVPIENKELFELKLGAQTFVEHGKGHFSDADIKELPMAIELIEKF